jgi:outer membrane receptor protein involved in Fe transport
VAPVTAHAASQQEEPMKVHLPTHHTTRRFLTRAGLLLALPTLASIAFAQAPSTAPTDTPADDDVVTLDAFTVSTERDVGYRATNSIAGTRTNTPIKDVPINIQVFTKDLADDLLIKNQVDFEAYNAALVNGGADRFSDNVIQQSYQNFLFRGFRQNWGLRDGVREYDPIDTQGLARVEVVKGPAAALYGLAYPGGVMNNITKVVEFGKNFSSVRLTAGGEGDYRASLDANVTGTVAGNQNIGIRFNGAYEKSQDIREHSEGDVRFSSLQFAWQPTVTTQVEFLAEKGYRARPNGLGFFTTVEAGAAGNQAAIPLQALRPEIPWEWNWSNGLNLDSLDTSMYRGRVTQQIGENFQVQAYMQYSSRLEKSNNGWDTTGGEYAGSGWDQTTNTIRSSYNYRDWGNQMHAYGATAVYKLDLEQVKNTFAFGTNVWKEDELSRRHTPLDPAASTIIYPVAANIPITVPAYPPPDTVPVMTGNGYHHEDNSNDYYFINWQASWLDQRLKTNIGFNKTNLKTIAWDNGNSMVADNIYEASKNSPLYGVVFDITKEISVFAVHSTSLFPDSTKDSFGNQFAPQVGKSWEGGVKVDLLDGKISGTVSYYQIEQTGGTQNDPTKENINTVRYDSLTPEQQQIEFGGVRPLGDIIEGGKQESKGFDIDIVFQPTRQWQIMTSFTHVDHEFTESAVPATLGQTYPQAIKDRYALLTKYTFTDGPLDRLSLGLGVSGGSKSLQDYQRRASNGDVYSGTGPFIDVARYEPGRTVAEVFGIYRFKLYGQNALVQLNIKNLLKTDDYVGWKATGNANTLATERYEVPTPIVYRLTLGFDF